MKLRNDRVLTISFMPTCPVFTGRFFFYFFNLVFNSCELIKKSNPHLSPYQEQGLGGDLIT